MDPKFYTQLYGNSPAAARLRNNYAVQLGDASTIWRKTKNATHEILNAGAALPITSGAVSAIRGVTNLFSWGSKASTETDSAIDAAAKAIKANKIKNARPAAWVILFTVPARKRGRGANNVFYFDR